MYLIYNNTQGRTKGIGRVTSIHYPDGTTATVAPDSELSAGGMYLCVCVCVCCVCIYIHTYVYTYTHAHTHTQYNII